MEQTLNDVIVVLSNAGLPLDRSDVQDLAADMVKSLGIKQILKMGGQAKSGSMLLKRDGAIHSADVIGKASVTRKLRGLPNIMLKHFTIYLNP